MIFGMSVTVLNLVFIGLSLVLFFILMKSADGFFAVLGYMVALGFIGFIAPFIGLVFNLITYGVTREFVFAGWSMAYLVALAVFWLVSYLDSRSYFNYVIPEKKLLKLFESSTGIQAEKKPFYIHYRGKGNETNLYFIEDLEKETIQKFISAIEKEQLAFSIVMKKENAIVGNYKMK